MNEMSKLPTDSRREQLDIGGNNNKSFASTQNVTTHGSHDAHTGSHATESSSLTRGNIPSNSLQSTPSSLKELKKSYHMKKKCFTRNVQSAIESTQEVHSGWLKARTQFKRWTKVWCQVKPGYLILYTSQEAQKKHRLGVVLLAVCQVIKRPTKKEGFCFKLINPLSCSVWAKSSTKAIVFAQASLTLRVSDSSIGKLWLDALHRCNLSANLEGYRPVIDEDNETGGVGSACNRSDDLSDSDDGDQSTRHLECMLSQSNTTSESNSVSSFRNQNTCMMSSGRPLLNGSSTPLDSDESSRTRLLSSRLGDNNFDNFSAVHSNVMTHRISDRPSSQVGNKNQLNTDINYNNNVYRIGQSSSDCARQSTITNQMDAASSNSNSTKMVTKFSKYSWKELQLESVSYVGDEVEELGSAGMQSEEVHDSNKNFLWHIIKQLRPGMDLSKVTLPTFILEPRSFLEKLADYYYHCDILSEAVLIDDPVIRLINIVKWYLSGFYKKPKGPKKPYNPILGERFRCFWEHPKTQSRTFFVAEQVSHHPPISAFHVSNRKDGYTITCALLSRSKYGGNSVSAILDGKAKLYLNKRGETYTLTMPYANCRGILLGSLCLELGGKVEIECTNTGCKCELDFKIAPMWANSNSYNSITGKILKDGKVTHLLDGHWDKKINIVDKQSDQKLVLWEVTDAIRNSRLKRYTVSLKDQHERESVKLWSKVTEALHAGDQTMATTEKTRLEDMQRQEARDRMGTFIPEHFNLQPELNEWLYRWQDDRAWDIRRDIMQFEENFKIRTLMLEQNLPSSTTFNPEIDLPLNHLSKFADKLQELNHGSGQTEEMSNNIKCPKRPATNNMDQDTFKTIESRITAGNLLFEEAIKQVNEKNRKLEEDIALLKRARGKRTLALFMTAIIVAILGTFFKYFA